ncbi:MAG: transcriptional repressor NrdR [Deltaproteobacteria bacterium]|nr:transcriptional repressor NrdR [Deltaproteobacteria bacterium]
MKCPYCGHLENKVVDSRLNKDYTITRRRRLCDSCARRFTTYERLEVTMPMLIKKDDRREAWDRSKVVAGLKKACEKRPVSMTQIEEFVDNLERELQDMGEREIPVRIVGARVMDALRVIDEVAYVRFASVYRQFKDLNEFMEELKGLLGGRENETTHDGS